MAYNKKVLSEIDRELKDRYRSKRYSKSLAATNSVFAVNDLFSKPSRGRIYNPNAQYFQGGGEYKEDPPLTYAQKLAAYNDSLAAYNWAKDNAIGYYMGDGIHNYDKQLARELEVFDPKSKTNYGDWFDTNNDGKIDEFIEDLTFEEYADKNRWSDTEEMFAMVDKFNVKPFIITTTDGYPLDPMYVKPTYPTKPTMKEAYETVDKDIYPTFPDFEFAAEFYKEYGENPDPSDLPSNRLPTPTPPDYEIEDVEPDIEIEKLDVIQPKLLSNDTELPELEERDEVEGVDYERKFGMWLENKAHKDAKLKTFLKYTLPEFFNDKPSRVSQYYRYPKKLRAGFYNEPIEEEANLDLIKQKGGPIEVKQRRGVRENPDGSVSSHLMRAEQLEDGSWVGFPSLFQDDKPYADDQQNWVDMSEEEDWMKVYEEAERRGEVYDFGEDKEAALAFGEGSWKDQLPEREPEEELYNMERARELGYERDGSGHLPSVDEETGMFLKSMDHPTAFKEYMYGQLNKDIGTNTRVVVNPEGHFGDKQLQYINAELDDDEIQKYVDGGYIVEEMAEGGDVNVKCPPGKAWNGKYCAKIQIVTEDGKKIKVVPSAYEMDNPTDPNNPYGIELQRLSDIDKLYDYQDEHGWDDEMTNKKICGDAGCHSVLIDDDTEIEDIEPIKERRTIEEIYPEVDHDKYPTIEDFDFAAKYYEDKGENPPDDLLPSNRVVEEEPEEEELGIEPLPVIEPEPIINVTPDPIIDDRVREDEIVEEEDIEDEPLSPEDWDVTEVWDNEGDAVILPYEETTGKYKKERRGTRRPRKKDRTWDGGKGFLQRIFTDKEYSGPLFPGLKRRIKQEGGVPEFQKGGKVVKKLVGTANDIKGDMLLNAVAPLQYLGQIRPNLSSLVPRFGLTKSLKDKFQLEQDLAAKDASDFVNDWFYKPDDKIIRPEVAIKIRDLYKEELSPEQFHQRKSFKTRLDNGEVDKWGVDKFVDGEQVITNPDLLESMLTLDQSSRYLDHPENVLNNKRNLLVGSNSNDILGNSNLSNYEKRYLLKKRFEIGGVNFLDDGPSVTLNKVGSFYTNPNTIAETAAHEAGHTSQNIGNWIDQVHEWDPKKSTYYRAKDKGPGEHFKKVLWPNSGENPLLKPFAGVTDYYGSVNELHSELMRGRFKVANKMAEAQMKKDGFTSKKYDDFQLRGIRKDYRVKAIEDLQNPSDQQIKQLIKAGSLNFHFKPGAKKADKYKAIRMLPGVGAAFALPSLMGDDDKPKLQKGGGISRPDIEYKSNKEIQDDAGSPSTGVDGYYDPTQNRIVIPPSATQHVLDHENFHAVQRGMGRMRVDPMTPKQEPSMLSSDELVNNYYNRHMNDVNSYYDNYADIVNPSSEQHERYLNVIPDLYNNPDIASEAPEVVTAFNKYWPKDMDLMTDEIKYRKAIEPLLYEDSYTMEGEAEAAARVLGQRRADYAERYPESKYGFPIDMFDAIEEDGLNPTLDYIFTGQRQMGGALELGDEVTENMVEELRRQGYTIEEI